MREVYEPTAITVSAGASPAKSAAVWTESLIGPSWKPHLRCASNVDELKLCLTVNRANAAERAVQ
jgi:hypothetical protein